MSKQQWSLEDLNRLTVAMETLQELGIWSASTYDRSMHLPIEAVAQAAALVGGGVKVVPACSGEFPYRVSLAVGEMTLYVMAQARELHMVGYTIPQAPEPVPLQAS